jgi:hypothetical protein
MEETMNTGCSLSVWLGTVKTSVRRFLDDAAMRRQLREELAGLGADLDRVLAEIGITRDEMEDLIENAPRSRLLLQAMLKRLGLEKRMVLLAPELARSIERRCATCGSQKVCGEWIAQGAPGDGYRRFCPNAETFDALPRGGKAA